MEVVLGAEKGSFNEMMDEVADTGLADKLKFFK